MLQHGKQEIKINITFIQESITISTCMYSCIKAMESQSLRQKTPHHDEHRLCKVGTLCKPRVKKRTKKKKVSSRKRGKKKNNMVQGKCSNTRVSL